MTEKNVPEKEKKQTIETVYPLTQHLEELRKRIVYIFFFLLVVFLVVYSQGKLLMNLLMVPVLKFMPENSTMTFLKLTEGFLTELKLSFLAAVFLSMPFLLYQAWRFVAPGLYAHERKYIFGFVISSSILFFAGASFAYFIVFPLGFQFFLKYAGPDWNMVANLSVSWYLSFVTQLVMAFGIVFELPVIVFFLVKVGMITDTMLKKYRRYAIVIIFIIAAVLTPPDVISQCLMAAPLLVLYEVSIYIAKVFGKKPEKTSEVDIYE